MEEQILDQLQLAADSIAENLPNLRRELRAKNEAMRKMEAEVRGQLPRLMGEAAWLRQELREAVQERDALKIKLASAEKTILEQKHAFENLTKVVVKELAPLSTSSIFIKTTRQKTDTRSDEPPNTKCADSEPLDLSNWRSKSTPKRSQSKTPDNGLGKEEGLDWVDSTGLDLLAEIAGLMSPADLAPTVETPGLASSRDASILTETPSSFSPGTTSVVGGNENSFSSNAALKIDGDSDFNSQEEDQVPPPIQTGGGCPRLRRYILANYSTSPSGNPPVESPSDPISCSCFCCMNLMDPTGFGLIVLAEIAGLRSPVDLAGRF